MISAEAPVLFAKACELFILELTLKAWLHAERSKRRTLQRSDIAAVVNSTYILDFLVGCHCACVCMCVGGCVSERGRL